MDERIFIGIGAVATTVLGFALGYTIAIKRVEKLLNDPALAELKVSEVGKVFKAA